MCGIIAVLRRACRRAAPAVDSLRRQLAAAEQAFAAGDVPLSLAIAVDHSFSVSRRQLRDVIDATQRLISELRPDDRVLLLGIGSQVEVLAPLSLDHRIALVLNRSSPPRAFAS